MPYKIWNNIYSDLLYGKIYFCVTFWQEQNVIDSDGTLVLNLGKLSGGTKRTVEFAIKHSRLYLTIQMEEKPEVTAVIEWIQQNSICTLNIAGPRESKCPGIYLIVEAYLRKVLERVVGWNTSFTIGLYPWEVMTINETL